MCMREWSGLLWFMSQKAVLCHETYSSEQLSCSSWGVSSFKTCLKSIMKQNLRFSSRLIRVSSNVPFSFCFKSAGGNMTAKSISKPLTVHLLRISVSGWETSTGAKCCLLVTHRRTGFSKWLQAWRCHLASRSWSSVSLAVQCREVCPTVWTCHWRWWLWSYQGCTVSIQDLPHC